MYRQRDDVQFLGPIRAAVTIPTPSSSGRDVLYGCGSTLWASTSTGHTSVARLPAGMHISCLRFISNEVCVLTANEWLFTYNISAKGNTVATLYAQHHCTCRIVDIASICVEGSQELLVSLANGTIDRVELGTRNCRRVYCPQAASIIYSQKVFCLPESHKNRGGALAVTGMFGGQLVVWDAIHGGDAYHTEASAHKGPVFGLSIITTSCSNSTPSRTFIASSGDDRTAALWELTTSEDGHVTGLIPLGRVQCSLKVWCTSICLLPAQTSEITIGVAIGVEDGTVKVVRFPVFLTVSSTTNAGELLWEGHPHGAGSHGCWQVLLEPSAEGSVVLWSFGLDGSSMRVHIAASPAANIHPSSVMKLKGSARCLAIANRRWNAGHASRLVAAVDNVGTLYLQEHDMQQSSVDSQRVVIEHPLVSNEKTTAFTVALQPGHEGSSRATVLVGCAKGMLFHVGIDLVTFSVISASSLQLGSSDLFLIQQEGNRQLKDSCCPAVVASKKGEIFFVESSDATSDGTSLSLKWTTSSDNRVVAVALRCGVAVVALSVKSKLQVHSTEDGQIQHTIDLNGIDVTSACLWFDDRIHAVVWCASGTGTSTVSLSSLTPSAEFIPPGWVARSFVSVCAPARCAITATADRLECRDVLKGSLIHSFPNIRAHRMLAAAMEVDSAASSGANAMQSAAVAYCQDSSTVLCQEITSEEMVLTTPALAGSDALCACSVSSEPDSSAMVCIGFEDTGLCTMSLGAGSLSVCSVARGHKANIAAVAYLPWCGWMVSVGALVTVCLWKPTTEGTTLVSRFEEGTSTTFEHKAGRGTMNTEAAVRLLSLATISAWQVLCIGSSCGSLQCWYAPSTIPQGTSPTNVFHDAMKQLPRPSTINAMIHLPPMGNATDDEQVVACGRGDGIAFTVAYKKKCDTNLLLVSRLEQLQLSKEFGAIQAMAVLPNNRIAVGTHGGCVAVLRTTAGVLSIVASHITLVATPVKSIVPLRGDAAILLEEGNLIHRLNLAPGVPTITKTTATDVRRAGAMCLVSPTTAVVVGQGVELISLDGW